MITQISFDAGEIRNWIMTSWFCIGRLIRISLAVPWLHKYKSNYNLNRFWRRWNRDWENFIWYYIGSLIRILPDKLTFYFTNCFWNLNWFRSQWNTEWKNYIWYYIGRLIHILPTVPWLRRCKFNYTRKQISRTIFEKNNPRIVQNIFNRRKLITIPQGKLSVTQPLFLICGTANWPYNKENRMYFNCRLKYRVKEKIIEYDAWQIILKTRAYFCRPRVKVRDFSQESWSCLQ